jgi:N-methylhydantoinase B
VSAAQAGRTVSWDGIDDAYIPGQELAVDPSLRLHDESAEVDPFLFEVLRHNIWNINDEHGSTILKVSGSPIASTAEDFQTAILAEDGEFVFFGPRVQTMCGTMDLAVRWMLENRGANPGIGDGDMFLCNDPWIGSTHQQDVGLYCPVFWDGELFCWVANALHQYDIGGSTPGGFCPDATDTFVEPVCIPAVKIVEGGERRQDVEDFYLRHSRMPELVALDLRAQIAGNVVARDRILGLIGRYGAAVIKGAVRKIISDAEQTFARRLAKLPDGTWRSRSYLDVALDGDRGLYPVAMQVEKSGEHLTFSMEGTAEQVGALNISFSCWRSGILTAVNPMLCHDLLHATGGPLRRMTFRPEAGTILCATRPASTSNAQIGVLVTGALATSALGRMLLADAELRREVFAPAASTQFPIDSLSGIDQWGKPYGTILLDPMMGGGGAFSFRDGVGTGGSWYNPRSIGPNVEGNEQYFPILYLYRREWTDSGGAGLWRGGNSGVLAFVAHGTDRIEHSTATSGVALPTSEGLAGGMPGAPCRYRLLRRSDVRDQFAARRIPDDFAAVTGDEEIVGPKQRGIIQTPDDVIEIAWCAGGGFGDPLERDPAVVLADVLDGEVSTAWAEAAYGVVIAAGAVDADGTATTRSTARAARIGRSPQRGADAGPNGRAIGDLVMFVDEAGAPGQVLACAACDTLLASESGASYKQGAVVRERPVTDGVPHMEDPSRYVDDALVLREFACPGCARLLAVEVARADDPPLIDIEVALV